jgi:hypothetical protein
LSKFFTRPFTHTFRAVGGNGRGPDLAREEESDRLRQEADLRASLHCLVGKLRTALQCESLPEADIGRFIAWVESEDALNRAVQLNRAVDLIACARQRFGAIVAFDHAIRQVLSGPPDALLQWTEAIRPVFEQLLALEPKFHAVRIEGDAIGRLVAWVAESGKIHPERLGRVSEFLESLRRRTFSATSTQRRWQEFLDATVASAVS